MKIQQLNSKGYADQEIAKDDYYYEVLVDDYFVLHRLKGGELESER